MPRADRRPIRLLSLALALAVGVALLAPPAHAQGDPGGPLPPGNVQAELGPPPAAPPPIERESQRGLVILTIGGSVAVLFAVLALSGVFKRKT